MGSHFEFIPPALSFFPNFTPQRTNAFALD
jgi:hypothetical protein